VASKALDVLGYNPSLNKAAKTLGMSEDELEQVTRESNEVQESIIKRSRDRRAFHNRKCCTKAYLSKQC
jgi:hypothetical protein